jgi:hypothetical protein
MTLPNDLAGLGMPVAQANRLGMTRVATGVSAAGSDQATATAITNNITVVGTTAASTGVVLPAISALGVTAGFDNDDVVIYNAGAQTLAVYPGTGNSINSGTANAKFDVATTKSVRLTVASATQWVAVLSA